ncbi:MAG: alpha/beta hydrolase [Mangrovibacterium sp.]
MMTLCVLLIGSAGYAREENSKDLAYQNYLSKQKELNQSFEQEFYRKLAEMYALDEAEYIKLVDSWRKKYTDLLADFQKECPDADRAVLFRESKDIQFSLDKLILDYPYYHERYTGEKKAIHARLDVNRTEFDEPELLQIDSFVEYLKAFLYYQSKIELGKERYKALDNQRLNATLNLIPEYITNREVIDYLSFSYLNDHMENFGVKNMGGVYEAFVADCRNPGYIDKIKMVYEKEIAGRADHRVETYKTVGPYDLDIHLFLPAEDVAQKKHPVMVYFHGGSWSEGKPDWSFSACKKLAKNGWVGVAVEYRLAYRHGSLPFEAVMDAKSSVRWLRQHADEYHIDSDRIVASGDSAGGHLVLALALVEGWNEETDDLAYSCVPDLLMVNSGVYDLTDEDSWVRKDLRDDQRDENLVKEISPNCLFQKGLPPALIIHGTSDRNVAFATANTFVDEMKRRGNNIEFHALEGAGHFIWFGKYAKQVAEIRAGFLKKNGYP